jgi:hypothetical protein
MPRPNKPIEGETPRSKTGCGYLYVVDNTASEYPEVFFRLGKAGGCPAVFLQALGMAVSVAIRAGVPKEKFIKMFNEMSCPNPCWDGPKHNLSCPDAIAKMLEEGDK